MLVQLCRRRKQCVGKLGGAGAGPPLLGVRVRRIMAPKLWSIVSKIANAHPPPFDAGLRLDHSAA